MPRASDGLSDAVVLISSEDRRVFGTGFAIRSDEDKTWILTCAHVVRNIQDKGQGTVMVSGAPASVVAYGEPEEADLAVLCTPRLEVRSLKLQLAGMRTSTCRIAGYGKLNRQMRLRRLEGNLGEDFFLEVPGRPRVGAWELHIKSGAVLEAGYSGSPVMCTATQTVFAIVSHKVDEGGLGYAISLAHLKDVWPQLPPDLLSLPPQLGAWLTQEQQRFLETLFQSLPLMAAQQMRGWCHDAMPRHMPYEIPAGLDALDMLQWLLEKGKLSGGQVPLLYVLRQLLPLVEHAETRVDLDTCLKQIRSDLGASEHALRTIPVSAKVVETPSLMLEIWPSASTGKRCNVQGWFVYSAERYFSVDVGGELLSLSSDHEEDRSNLIENLRRVLGARDVDLSRVTVEFVLPKAMLSEPLEQWSGEIEKPIGTYLPVVLRSRERLTDAREGAGWKMAWDRLAVRWDQPIAQALCGLEKSQRRHIERRLQQGMVLALCDVPDLQDRRNAVYELLYHGAAIALWPRQVDSLDALIQELNALTSNQQLKNLPQAMRDMRLKLWEEKQEHLPCYHYALLWDDPTRRMPDKPKGDDDFLQAPGLA